VVAQTQGVNTSAAVVSFGHSIYQESAFRSPLSDVATPIRSGNNHAAQVKRVLKEAGLTMAEVSAQTRHRFGKKSSYFVPQTLLYKQKTGITPHICQVAALSEVTGYRFYDWMRLCGFDFRLILALQLQIPNQRTIVVTPHADLMRNWFTAPVNTGAGQHHRRHFYAKVGSQDAVAYPEIRPGSIVRADPAYSPELLTNSQTNDHLWLVEHPAGITCCRVKPVGNGQVVLSPNRPPLSPWPLRLSTQARVLGLVDRELRYAEIEEVYDSGIGANREMFGMSLNFYGGMSFSRMLRRARCRIGLTFREAHQMTLSIAHLLENRDFGIAAGLLSDYEAMNKIPRHIAKIISLCVVYGIDPSEMLEAAGLRFDDSRRRPILSNAGIQSRSMNGEDPENQTQ
jgi:hypothetical protein